MLNKIALVSVFTIALTGCMSTSTTYDFTPSTSTNKILSIDKDNKSIQVSTLEAELEITSLEPHIGSSINPKLRIKITNNTDFIMPLKSSDIRMSFNNFWFDVSEYEIVNDDRKYNFKNKDNFKIIHEILPNKSMELDVTFNAPQSREFYERKDVLIEVYTKQALFNIVYKINKI